MLPSPALFGRSASTLGVSNDSHVVVYDTVGLYSAARVWWMFRVFGHERDLDPCWRPAALAGGRPPGGERRDCHRAEIVHRRGAATTRWSGPLSRSARSLGTGQRADRGRTCYAARFTGEDPGPRPDLPRGHIPGSRNVPFNAVLDDDDVTLGDTAVIRRAFTDAGVDSSRPVIATCGSGITACTLVLALAAIGAEEVAVYDGSWTDWGSRADAPVESGGPA